MSETTEVTSTVEVSQETKVDSVVAGVGIESKVEEVVAAVATTVATGGELKDVIKILGITESNLTEGQKKLATTIYEKTKAAIESIIKDTSLDNSIKVTLTIGQLVKQLESAQVDGHKPSGADKKAVAVELGRILINELAPNKDEILPVYNLLADRTLEAMIDVSRAVNVAVQEVAAKCCPGILSLFKKSN